LGVHQGILIFVQPDDSTPRLALPQVLTEEVIQAFNEQYGHFGVSKVYSMVRRCFFFQNMRRRIERLVKSCDLCQKTKYPNRGLCGEMNAIIAGNPGDLVTVDYYGPLPPSRSRVSYILVVIDAFSKFVKLYPLRRAQARISVRRVVEDFHRVVPIKVILSDHGTQFQSRLWQDTLRQWGITPTIVVYSPSSVEPHGTGDERVRSSFSGLLP
jgi:hypothetical protein